MVQKARFGSLFLIHVLILLHVYYFGSEKVGSIDFQEFFHSFIKLGVINAGVILVIVAFSFTLFFGRFFCGWACHFGAIQELSWSILKKLNIKPKTIDSKLVTILPLIILLNFYILPNILHAFKNPWSNIQIILNEPDIWAFLPNFIIGTLTFFIDGFLIVYFLGKKGFCRFICPWGAFLKIPTSLSFFKVRKTGECTFCHVCTDQCPIGIDVSYEINKFNKVVSSNCTSCLNCTQGCPSNSLSYKFENPFKESYKINHFLPQNDRFTHKNISKTFKSIRKKDIIILIGTLLLGFSIDGLYGMGHFMSYGISLISTYFIFEVISNYSNGKKILICSIIILSFIFHGIIKYSIASGLKYYHSGHYNHSINHLERVVSFYPKKIGRFHAILSEMYLFNDELNEALKHANKAKEINPNYKSVDQLLNEINKRKSIN